ncbi:MAG: MGMT family protein [Candidatus Jorgensenbacteria bacterium]|nr:MGMT family protein [Candidatus Jorgensenbacteria bacterium]
MTPSFTEKVYAVTRRIPRGRVTTYQKIARLLRNPRAVRAVGNALNKSPAYRRPRVPCHRVVRSDGTVGGFASGTRAKISLLRREGVIVEKRKVDLKRFVTLRTPPPS